MKQNTTAFTARYSIDRLVYYQGFLSLSEAEKAEKFIKGKTRGWKRALISKDNPKWKNLNCKVSHI